MAFRRLQYQFTADGRQFRSETSQMGREADGVADSVGGISNKMLGLAGLATAVLEAFKDIRSTIDDIAQSSLDRLAGAALVGGDRAESEAFRILSSAGVDISAEQAFDTTEAISDALRGKADTLTDPILAGLGFTEEEFTAVDSADRFGFLLDRLVDRGGVVDDTVLQAASELGAGDIRDVAAYAGQVSTAPGLDYRRIAEQVRPTLPSAAEDAAAVEAYISRQVDARRGEYFAGAGGTESAIAAVGGQAAGFLGLGPEFHAALGDYDAAVAGGDSPGVLRRAVTNLGGVIGAPAELTGVGTNFVLNIIDGTTAGVKVKPDTTSTADAAIVAVDDRRDTHIYRGE